MITKLKLKVLEAYGPGNQNRFAASLNINPGRFSQYCTGLRRIPAHHLLLISRALHCHPTELVGYREMEDV